MESDSTPGERHEQPSREPQDCVRANELLAISRAIRPLLVAKELRSFVKHDTNGTSQLVAGEPIHPDSAELAACCRRAGHAVASLSQGKIRQLYTSLLRTRRAALLIDRAERESPGALAKALGAISAGGDGNDDDLVLVWLRLPRQEPCNAVTGFTPEQIGRARRHTAIDRQRSDAFGAGAAHEGDRKHRARALKLLGLELGVTQTQLTGLPLEAYRGGSMSTHETREPVVLTDETAAAVNAWLEVRDKRSHKLFPPALARCAREAAIGGTGQPLWQSLASREDEERRLDTQDALVRLWGELGSNARSLIFHRISNAGGWSPDFVQWLAESSAEQPLTGIVLSRQEARTAQEEIREAWKRHPDKEHYRSRNSTGCPLSSFSAPGR